MKQEGVPIVMKAVKAFKPANDPIFVNPHKF